MNVLHSGVRSLKCATGLCAVHCFAGHGVALRTEALLGIVGGAANAQAGHRQGSIDGWYRLRWLDSDGARLRGQPAMLQRGGWEFGLDGALARRLWRAGLMFRMCVVAKVVDGGRLHGHRCRAHGLL